MKLGRILKKRREKAEDEVMFHKAQMREDQKSSDSGPKVFGPKVIIQRRQKSSLYDHQQPSSSDQLYAGT
jgi:hypothetical protein